MNQVVRLFCSAVIGLLVISGVVSAQPIDERIERLTIKQGLSNLMVKCILQDRQGFMWFGTENGLNKYDGYSFTVYQTNPTDPKRSLQNNIITSLLESRFGELWVLTNLAGLHHFDKQTGIVTAYRVDSSHFNDRDVCNRFIEDRRGQLWICSSGGLNCFNPSTKRFTLYPPPGDPSDNTILMDVCQDQAGNIWVCTEKGLYQLDQQRKVYRRFALGRATDLRTIYKDAQGLFWIPADGLDLYCFDPTNGQFELHTIGGGKLTGDHLIVNELTDGSANELWVGTAGDQQAGLYRFDKRSKHWMAYPVGTNGLSSSSVYSMYKDRWGTLWVGTDNGINKLDQKPAQFKTTLVAPAHDNVRLADNNIAALCKDRRGYIWLGNHAGNLYRYDLSTNQLRSYAIPMKKGSDRYVAALHVDRSDTLWIAMYGGGLYALTPDRQRFIHYPFEAQVDYETITEDAIGRIWVSTHDRIAYLNKQTGKFSYYRYNPADAAGLPTRYPAQLQTSRTGAIWVGTQGEGMWQLNPTTNRWQHYGMNTLGKGRQLTDGNVIVVYEDQAGMLWIGTVEGGLNRLNPATGAITAFTVKNGLPSNRVESIQPDNHGNLWLGTDRGLCCFNPNTGVCRNFYESDGLKEIEFTKARTVTSDGKVVLGTRNGIALFHPDHLKINSKPLPVYITGVKVGDIVYPLRSHRIELPHYDNFLVFDFVALDYDAKEKIQYAYQLDGLDNGWVKSGDRSVRYPNLGPGHYVFKVKASNHNGGWSREYASIAVVIHPPWWRTWWFYAGCLLFGALVSYWIVKSYLHLRLRQQRERFQVAFQSQQEERKRLAKELHDSICPDLVVLKMQMEVEAGKQVSMQSDQLRPYVGNIKRIIGDIRAVSHALMPAEMEQQDLVAAIEGFVWQVSAANDRLEVNFSHFITNALPKPLTYSVFQMVKELVNNSVKYARASLIDIELIEENGSLQVVVADDGQGYDPVQMPLKEGIGLRNIQSSVAALNGTFEIIAKPNGGMLHRIQLPNRW